MSNVEKNTGAVNGRVFISTAPHHKGHNRIRIPGDQALRLRNAASRAREMMIQTRDARNRELELTSNIGAMTLAAQQEDTPMRPSEFMVSEETDTDSTMPTVPTHEELAPKPNPLSE